jgi:hypothetical protein
MKRLPLAPLVLVTLAALALGATAASAAESVTIGQTLPNSTLCATSWLIQTSSPSSYVVPADNLEITEWSTFAGDSVASGGSMALVVFRPTGSGSYEVVATSPVQALTPNTLNTFKLASPIVVQKGDLIGMYEDQANCYVAATTSTILGGFALNGPPPVGTTLTQGSPGTFVGPFQLNISATLTPVAPPLPTAADQCKEGNWGSFDVFKNQGDCVSFLATKGTNPPSGG